jgi:hypothetical protein
VSEHGMLGYPEQVHGVPVAVHARTAPSEI